MTAPARQTPTGHATAKRSIDVAKIAMGVWTALVITFLFIPILMVIRHSFNSGGSLIVWAGSYSTEWWGNLFDGGRVVQGLLVSIGVIGISVILARLSKRPALVNWAAPVGVLLAVAVNAVLSGSFRDFFDNANVGDTLRNSFIAAAGATVIAVIMGGTAGVALARRTGHWSKPFMFVLFLVLVTPEIMDAIALLGWFVRLGGPFNTSVGPVNNGILRLWVGQSLYTSALVTLIVRARLEGLDASLEEAAADLGATPYRAFREITLPLISSALVAGGLLSFTLCLDNTIIANAVATAGSTTFPVFVIGTAKSTTKPFVGAAAVVLFGVTVASLAFVYSVLKRSGQSSSEMAATFTGS
ncbi:MAG: ABC transporter permease subunit [Acidimicrobiales bacterium]